MTAAVLIFEIENGINEELKAEQLFNIVKT